MPTDNARVCWRLATYARYAQKINMLTSYASRLKGQFNQSHYDVVRISTKTSVLLFQLEYIIRAEFTRR